MFRFYSFSIQLRQNIEAYLNFMFVKFLVRTGEVLYTSLIGSGNKNRQRLFALSRLACVTCTLNLIAVQQLSLYQETCTDKDFSNVGGFSAFYFFSCSSCVKLQATRELQCWFYPRVGWSDLKQRRRDVKYSSKLSCDWRGNNTLIGDNDQVDPKFLTPAFSFV